MVFRPQDVPIFFGDTDDRLTLGEVTGPCILFIEDRLLDKFQGPQAVVRQITAMIETARFPDIAAGNEVTVNGTNYIVSRDISIQDGGCTEVQLQKGN